MMWLAVNDAATSPDLLAGVGRWELLADLAAVLPAALLVAAAWWAVCALHRRWSTRARRVS